MTAALKLTGAGLFTFTRNDPLVLPGALPAGVLNSVPAGESVRLALAARNSVTGTVPTPPEVAISPCVREKPGLSRLGSTITGMPPLTPPAKLCGEGPTVHHGASHEIDANPSEPPPAF